MYFSCWLNDADSEVIQTANRRVEAITGLNMQTAEELQISNYGVGGQYEPHFDFARVSSALLNLLYSNIKTSSELKERK